MVEYLPAERIIETREVRVKPWQRTPSGYGNKLLTSHMVKLEDKRWRRIYAICYSNVASLYVKVAGERLFIGPDAEERIEQRA